LSFFADEIIEKKDGRSQRDFNPFRWKFAAKAVYRNRPLAFAPGCDV
jgi:hypothetical protein